MFTRSFVSKASLVAGALLTAAAADAQNFFVPGSFSSEAGFGGDWNPPTAPLMTAVVGQPGVFNLDFTLTGTTAGQGFAFKILNDTNGDGANWSDPDDPEVTPQDVPFDADADGIMSITLNTNTLNDGYSPATNRIAITDDYSAWTAVGNFQTQLGSPSDFNNSFAGTAMTLTSTPGVYALTTTIPTAGTYSWRAVKTGSFAGIGGNGRSNNSSNITFNTFETNQEVTFEVNTNIGGIRFLTDAVLAGDTDNNGVVNFDDFTPIRNNFLTVTSLRANGDLDFSGFVDIADFREWKNAFSGPPELVALALTQLQSVPEPSGLLLVGLAALAGGSRRRVG